MNAHLPQGWLSAQVELNLQINPDQPVEERDYENNSLAASLSFREMPALDVVIVPIAWEGINGFYPAPTSFDYIQRSLEKMYPVSQVIIRTHSNFNYDGPLETSFGWNDLLDEIWLLRSREKAPKGRSYYGVIPPEDSQGRTWLYYGNGIKGNGFVGERAAIGLASSANYGIDGGVIAAHETGHNLGRLHSPCGTTNGVGSYPYSGAAIGNYGLDVTNLVGFSLIPSDYKDIMSYCTPVWVSDYTYAIWMESQENLLTQSPQLPDQPGIMIRAQIDSNGDIQLLPFYSFEGLVEKSHVDGKYRIELIGSEGTLIGRYDLSPLQFGDTTGGLLSALLPLPQEAVSEVRVLTPDQLETRKILHSASAVPAGNVELVEAPGGSLIRWGQPATPALISYTQGDDPSITTLEVDWMGGEYFLDPAALPNGPLQFDILLADQTSPALRVNWTNTQP